MPALPPGTTTQLLPATQTLPSVLADLLPQTRWEADRRGPLLIVDAVHTLRDKTLPLPPPDRSGYVLRDALPAFHRALFETGTLTVIAPTEMTRIESAPREQPNLYDGLPRALKVKYLLSTLTLDQWKRLAAKGLGVDELAGEQRAVYLSLLPTPFIVDRWVYDENGEITARSNNNREEIIPLTPEQRAQVKLHINRNVNVSIPFANQAHTYLATGRDIWRGKPHSERLQLDTRAEMHTSTLFGVALSAVVPNKLKPSQLDYAATRLTAYVTLSGAETVGDLIARVGTVTGLEMYADARVARLKVTVYGERARAGDVLKALALAVTGTYRKVDTAFVLTSDLMGIGTRHLRLTEWQAQIQEEVNRREAEMTRQIQLHSAREGGIYAMGFAANDPYALPPALNRQAEQEKDVPADALTPELAWFVHDYVARHEKYNPTSEIKLNDTLARLELSWNFGFELADGRPLLSGGTIASYGEFKAPPPEREQETPAKPRGEVRGPLPLPAWAHARMVFLTPRTMEESGEMTRVAQQLGFTDLVLCTDRNALLKAALDTVQKTSPGAATKADTLRISAAIAPFAPGGTPDTPPGTLDRNLLNETAGEIVTARTRLSRWQKHVARTIAASSPSSIPEKIIGVSGALAPVGPPLEARFRQIAGIAALEGLANLFFCDTQPGGYAGQRLALWEINYDRNDMALPERENLGYVPALRLAFLRERSIDPIDLIPPGIHPDVDLPLPFFPDPEASHRYSGVVPEETAELLQNQNEAWDRFRGKVNRSALAALYAVVRAARPDLPLYMEGRAEWLNDTRALRYWPAYARWTQADRLPIATQDFHSRRSAAKGDDLLWPRQLSADEQVPARTALLEALQTLERMQEKDITDPTIAFDLSSLKGDRALALLRSCVQPPITREPNVASPSTK